MRSASSARLLRTDDGGASWSGVSTGLTEDLDQVRMISANSVVVAGGCPVRRSDDGGKTFRRLPWTASDARCTAGVASLAFRARPSATCCCTTATCCASSDSGKTWSRRTACRARRRRAEASRIDPTDLVFTSRRRASRRRRVGGDLYSTTDGGSTWDAERVPSPSRCARMWFPTDQVGYAVGDAPVVLKTTDGGATWNELGLPRTRRPSRASAARAPTVWRGHDGRRRPPAAHAERRRGLAARQPVQREAARGRSRLGDAAPVAVGDAGTTVLSSDAGRTFSPLGGEPAGLVTGVKAQSTKIAYAFGQGGALRPDGQRPARRGARSTRRPPTTSRTSATCR